MNYKDIQLALEDLYGYFQGINVEQLKSEEGKIIYHRFIDFLTSLNLKTPKNKYEYRDEKNIYFVIYEYCFDLLEDYEDLSDHDFENHLQEYQFIHQINSQIIGLLADDTIDL